MQKIIPFLWFDSNAEEAVLGLSWQIVPTILPKLLHHKDPEKSKRAMQAMLQMKKIDIEALKRAAGE